MISVDKPWGRWVFTLWIGYATGMKMSFLRQVHRAIGPALPLVCLMVSLVVSFSISISSARGEALSLVSDEGHTWWAVPDIDQGKVRIYHHHVSWELSFREIATYDGLLVPGGLAQDKGSVWLTFNNGSIQRLRAEEATNALGFRYDSTMMLPIPGVNQGDVVVMSISAHALQPWVLLRCDSQSAVDRLDSRTRQIQSNLQPTSESPESSEPSEQADHESAKSDEAENQTSFPVYRLLVMQGTQWDHRTLPRELEDMGSSLTSAKLVWLGGDMPQLGLLTQTSTEQGQNEYALFVQSQGQWEHRELDWSFLDGHDRLPRMTNVDGQLVLVHAKGDEGYEATLIRSDRLVTLPIEDWLKNVPTLESSDSSEQSIAVPESLLQASADDRPWTMGTWHPSEGQQALAMFIAERAQRLTVREASENPGSNNTMSGDEISVPAPRLWVTAVSLQGESILDPTEVESKPVQPWEGRADTLLLICVLATSMVLTLAAWKWGAQHSGKQLPITIRLAGLLPRLVAAWIDLLPGYLLAMWVFHLSPMELSERWPPQPDGMSWAQMLPAGLTVLIYLMHTIPAEMISGRTLGKIVMGIRVVRYDGSTIRPWQAALRGVLKTFDLLIWMLLILAILNPGRQRLGDLVGRTVVVTRRKLPPGNSPGSPPGNHPGNSQSKPPGSNFNNDQNRDA